MGATLDETPWSSRPCDIDLNSGLAADALFPLSIAQEAPLGVRRVRLPWHGVCGLSAQMHTRGAHTWMRTCFYLTEGCLVTLNHKHLSATATQKIWYLYFTKKLCDCYQMISDLSKQVWKQQKDL